MEFLIIFLPILLTVFFTGRKIFGPYIDGTKQIDTIKYPTLARAQRIHRYSNVKDREVEASARLKELTNKKNDIILESGNASARAVAEVAAKHQKESNQWWADFKAITAAEDARKAAQELARGARQRAKEQAAREELRAKELEIWTINERARLKRFKAEQEAVNAAEAQRVQDLLRGRENQIQALSAHHVGGKYNPENAHTMVNVHGLYVRKLPTKDSRIVDNLVENSWVTVNGWISYEELYGNPIWFRLANGKGWIWSGGVLGTSTAALENLNYWKEEGDSFTTKTADGSICHQYTIPSHLQCLIDQEIEALKREKSALESKTTSYYQTTRPTGPISVGSTWFDTSNGNKSHTWDGYVWIPYFSENFSANLITAGSITVSPQEISVFKNARKTYQSNRSKNYTPQDHTGADFWRGTEYESE